MNGCGCLKGCARMWNWISEGGLDFFVICTYVLSCLRQTPPPLRGTPSQRGKGLIRLIIIRHYESDEDLGFGFDGGCDAAGGMQTGEGGTGEECAC